MMNEKLLLLEDDLSLVDGLTYALQKNGFQTQVARTVKEALDLLSKNRYDLLLLDVTLPDGTGFQVCEKVRSRDSRTPILFLTASDEEVHVIRGLDCGGDDYLTKPFRLGELCSRIRALLRRASTAAPDSAPALVCGDITIDRINHLAILRGIPLDLTGAEYKLLSLLVRNAGRTLTRDVIFDELWDGTGKYVDDNTMSVYIRRLREKVETEPSNPDHLLTVRGFGYQWKEVTP